MFELPKEPFARLLHRVVHGRLSERRLSTRDLADRVGVNHRTFQYWMEVDSGRHCPAEVVPELCNTLRNHELLDALEGHARRIAFPLPDGTGVDDGLRNLRAVQELVKEVGDALSALSDTLADDRVDGRELERTDAALNDVIRECARLKHWLAEHHRVDSRHPSRR